VLFRSRTSTIPLTIVLFGFLIFSQPSSAADALQARISHNTAAGTWTLTSGGASLTLNLDPSRDFSIQSLTIASGKTWTAANLPDTTVTAGGREMAFGARAAGFRYQAVTVDQTDGRLTLNATFDLSSPALRVTRHYAIAGSSPSFEAWTTFQSLSGPIPLANLNAISLTLTNGPVRWLTGLQGDSADVASDGAFTLEQVSLAVNQHWSVGAAGRASEQTVPWFAIDGDGDEFYAALMWSGAWSLQIDRGRSGLATRFGLAPMNTVLDAAVDGPHVVFGVAQGGLTEATSALRSYILAGIRHGRPLQPLVTYNTWFAYGTELDEASMLDEMDRVAALGVELFVVDAGWYPGAGAAGPMDFDAGLGVWTPDPDRFPNGLGPLRDRAHALGMKFGLWVEPERVNLSVLPVAGVDETWLATDAGDYQSDHAGQICLASDAARAYVLDWLSAFIDDVQPDYLKWDNNMWVNCNRDGHGHGAADGNFAHVNGLYDVLSTLREWYPNLLIENVSGGGNRLDVGMLRYSDAAWMDDRTAPSVHVRHNIEGLSAVFPPAYLLSFVTDHDGEPLHEAPDLSLYFRSRMAGTLGLCFRSDGFSEADFAGIAHEIDIYKAMRDTLSQAASALLTKQAAASDATPAWDVLQEASGDGAQALLCAYQSDSGVGKVNVKPTGLSEAGSYNVTSVDTGLLGTASGADLMLNGIDILQSPNTAAHILIIRRQQ